MARRAAPAAITRSYTSAKNSWKYSPALSATDFFARQVEIRFLNQPAIRRALAGSPMTDRSSLIVSGNHVSAMTSEAYEHDAVGVMALSRKLADVDHARSRHGGSP
jgi:hypothetical protein